MASTINTNISSLTAQRNLGTSQTSLTTSIQRLSSGSVSYTHLTLPTSDLV